MSVTNHSIHGSPKDDPAGFQGLCRLCMRKKMYLKCVFSAELINTVEEIRYCTGILVTKDDGLPTTLCDSCRINLAIAHQFKTTCLHSDTKFRQILKEKVLESDIKEEVIGLDDDSNYEYMAEFGNHEDSSDRDVIADNETKAKPINPNLMKANLTKTKPIMAKMRANISKSKLDSTAAMYKRLLGLQYCKTCDQKFSSKELAMEHKCIKRQTEWICEICGKLYKHRPSHYSHIKSHFPPQHQCSYCDYKAGHKADLDKHIRIHTGNKKYVCEYCTSSFYSSSNLRRHIRIHHGGGEPKPHRCPRCDLSFCSVPKLRRHLDSHDNIKRHECDVCHSRFTRRCHWKKHLQKQHSITVPRIRPGRRKTNYIKGEEEKISDKCA